MAMANPLGHFTCFLDEDRVATAPGTHTYPRFQRVLGHTFRLDYSKGDCWVELGLALDPARRARRAHELSLIGLARIFLDFKNFLRWDRK
jgi:hypothetical protein